jgi:hypothetical protein
MRRMRHLFGYRTNNKNNSEGCIGPFCRRLFGYRTNNENEEQRMYREANEYQREKVAAAAAETRRENAERRALYGANTRAATRRRHEEHMNHARQDGVTPRGFFR